VLSGTALLLAGFVAITACWFIVGFAGVAVYRRRK
jgi:hypothetical protein